VYWIAVWRLMGRSIVPLLLWRIRRVSTVVVVSTMCWWIGLLMLILLAVWCYMLLLIVIRLSITVLLRRIRALCLRRIWGSRVLVVRRLIVSTLWVLWVLIIVALRRRAAVTALLIVILTRHVVLEVVWKDEV